MRVLVTVASRHGGTREIGARVATELTARGHVADQVEPESVMGLDGYDAVVLGSAVYTGHWLPAARELAVRLAAELGERPVWLLSSGLATSPAAAANSPAETQALIDAIHARGHRAFGGRLDLGNLDLAERAVISAARSKEGDHRDLDAVTRWAGGVADQLTASVASPASVAV